MSTETFAKAAIRLTKILDAKKNIIRLPITDQGRQLLRTEIDSKNLAGRDFDYEAIRKQA